MLSWHNIGKVYGRRRLFDSLSGQIAAGGGMVVTGANGVGKSTFLKALVGLVRVDCGVVNRPDDRNAIGYAAPALACYGDLTGLENLRFYASLRGVTMSEQAAAKLLARLGIERAASKPSSVYSTGMAQRLRIACALAHEPSLLVLDEPTLGLDSDGVLLVEQIVADHAVQGPRSGAAIIATNDTGQLDRFAELGWPILALGA